MARRRRGRKRVRHMDPPGKKGGPWHPCDDCIDPIAEALEEIAYKDWHAVGCTPPHPSAILMMYERDHCLAFLITWLKVNISVEFAVDLEATVFQPAIKYLHLDSRAHEIRHGEKLMEYSSDQEDSENFVALLLSEWRMELRTLPPEEREAALADKNSPLVEIEAQFRDIQEALQYAVTYLRRVSAVLRAKLADKAIERADVGQMTEPMTNVEIGKWLGISRNRVGPEILDNPEWACEKVGKQHRLPVAKMPPKYHAHHAQQPPAGK